MRLDVHVRPGSSKTAVGGEYDSALVVRVASPADSGRATEAALSAVAAAVGVPRRSVKLLRSATSRRKLFEIEATTPEGARIRSEVERLRSRDDT